MWQPIHKFSINRRSRTNSLQNSFDFNSQMAVPPGFLMIPKTELINEEELEVNGLKIGHSSMQGYRSHMEDAHIMQATELAGHSLVGILDGHVGKQAADEASQQFLAFIQATDEWRAYAAMTAQDSSEAVDTLSLALVSAFLNMDANIRAKGIVAGTTAVLALITPSHILCASVGDSRCVLGLRSGQTVSMSEDHKPKNREEKHRIVSAGGFVKNDRVNGELAMSRALGDFQYKATEGLSVAEQMVVPIPDIGVHRRSADDVFAILACDGVWDVQSNEVAVFCGFETLKAFSAGEMEATEGASFALLAARDQVQHAFDGRSTDNISVVVVDFRDWADKEAAVALQKKRKESAAASALVPASKSPKSK